MGLCAGATGSCFLLEAVVAGGYLQNAMQKKRRIMGDLEKHERAIENFLKRHWEVWPLPNLRNDFSSIDLTTELPVLNAAKTFEDLGVDGLQLVLASFLESADLL